MTAWLSLLKKELRLGFPVFLFSVIAFIVVASIVSYRGYLTGLTWEALTIISGFAIGVNVFFLPIYLFYSLQSERKKLHLWLHNLMPSYSLLLAKVVAGLISMIGTLLLTGGTFLLALNQVKTLLMKLEFVNMTQVSLWGGSHLFLFSIDFAVWFLFYWMFFLLCTRYLGTFLSFLSTFVFFILTTSIYIWFTTSWIYQKLIMWGQFHLPNMIESSNFHIDTIAAEFFTEINQITLFAGEYLFEIVIAFILFIVSCWILDRKVEV